MMNLNFHSLFVSLFFSSFPFLLLACNRLEHESLLSFSLDLTTENSQPLDWPSLQDCCSWEGIQCNDLATQVTRLSLPQRGLTGQMSPFLGNLTRLSYLNLSHNSLSGPLPREIFSLHFLETLDLSYNSLTGALPPSLSFKFIKTFDLSNNDLNGEIPLSFFQVAEGLVSLNVSNNYFVGSLPSWICNNSVLSSSVMFLDFSYNDFEGNIPLGLGKCLNLRVLIASYNSLTGPIPSDVYNITSLQVLCLHVNRLSGTISPRLTQLENLDYIELRNNLLNGWIPDDIGRLWKLKSLLLQSNRLTGRLPLSLMNCTNLVALILRVNGLQGNLSSFDFSRFSNLRLLDLGNNNFTGILPPSIYACKSLQAIRFSGNLLEGQISPEILSLNSLRLLSLSSNKLTNITSAIRVLSSCKNLTTLLLCGNFINEALPYDEQITSPDGFGVLRTLALCGSNLTGQVPAWLRNIKKLSFLDISGNKLTGSVPGWLGNLPKLFYLNVSANSLSGEISDDLFNMQALKFGEISLDLPIFLMPNCVVTWQFNSLASIKPAWFLSGNKLTGKIPTEIGQLKFLHILDLSQNEFSGEIPEQISRLTRLETLDVSRNTLSGEIPPSLTKLSFLSRFIVADNNLHGPIPSGGQFDTFPSSSFEGNSGLCGSVLGKNCSGDQPRTRENVEDDSSFSILKSSELRFGIIAGVVFGLISCFIIGTASPMCWLKSRGQIVRNEKSGGQRNGDTFFWGRRGISSTSDAGFSGWSSSPKNTRNSESS